MVGSQTRTAGRPRWRRWFPVGFGIALLVLAPALAHAQSADTVVVRWTAPGDDGAVGTATAYDLRVSDSPITAENFAAATAVSDPPPPLRSGTAQQMTVRGLTRGTTYYFAVKTVDDQGNWSGISNLVRWDWTLDTAPPAAPNAPTVVQSPDGVLVTWRSCSELDLAGYNVYRGDDGSATVIKLTDIPISTTEFLDATAPSNPAAVWYEVTALDLSGNESARSGAGRIAFAARTAWKLETGYPNPSHAGESVHFPVTVPASGAGEASVDILDAGGHRVRRLPLSSPQPGVQQVVWDGRNDAGRETTPGVYRGWLIAGDTRISVRVLRVP